MRLMSLGLSAWGEKINVKIILMCLKNNRINVKDACLSSPSSPNCAHVRPVGESQTR